MDKIVRKRLHPALRSAMVASVLMLTIAGSAPKAQLLEADLAVDEERPAILPTGRANYFPADVIGNSEYYELWFGNQLAAMREPVLRTMERPRGRNAYVMRILFLPSFDPAYAVRIDARGDRPSVRMTTLTGQAGYDPGEIATTRTERVPRDLADTIAALKRASRLESVSVHIDFSSPDADICTDGMHAVVELVDQSGYHVFERQQCGTGDEPLLDAIIAAATIAEPLPEHVRRYL